MSNPAYNLCVFVGRFQPLHAGHVHVMRQALEHADRLVVLVGSSNRSRSSVNPFTARERIEVIRETLDYDPRVLVTPIADSVNDANDWTHRVEAIVHALKHDEAESVALIGHAKDASSYYLKLFPRWASIDVEQHRELSATHLRDRFFRSPEAAAALLAEQEALAGTPEAILPMASVDFLREFAATPVYRTLAKGYHATTAPGYNPSLATAV
jgi:cytidyltransferase-like protein